MKDKVVLVISPEAWGINFVSKHHYANHLAKSNTVYFLNPPTSSGIIPKGMNIYTEEVDTNLVVVNYQNLVPKLDRLPYSLQAKTYAKQAKKIQKELGIEAFDLIWNFDPFRFYNQHVWKSNKRLYHCVDFHFTAKHENVSIKTADLTVVISDLMTKYFDEKPARTLRLGHGFNPDLHEKEVVLPGSNNLKAMYVGNVAGLLDIDRIIVLAEKEPKVDFILIGPYESSNLSQSESPIKERLSKYKNIFLIGAVKPAYINAYLKQGDINLLLIRNRQDIPITNSHKLMEYFNSGNVTLSDYLIDYENVNPNLLTLSQNKEQFQMEFSEIVSTINTHNSSSFSELRKNHAIANSYAEKINVIWKKLNVDKA